MTALTAHTRVHEIGRYILHRQPAPPQLRRILDMGCGDGARAIALAAKQFNRVMGVDSSESLLAIARNRARKRRLDMDFLRADAAATALEAGSFDEVLLLGGLFGQGKSARADVELLLEAQRLLRPAGVLRLRFTDGAWLKENCPGETVEPLPDGFIYRNRAIVAHGHCLRTEIISAEEQGGIRHCQVLLQWLYTPREVSDLLYRLGFRALAYEENDAFPAVAPKGSAPLHTIRCIVPPGWLQPVPMGRP